jgi:regulator of nonsense transcripts 1
MLSNPALEERGLFKEVPVERLIIDEASQIRVFEFLVSFFDSFCKRMYNAD